MTTPIRHDPDRALEAFFEPGPRHLSEAVAAAIHDDVRRTRQRRGLPRWEDAMTTVAIPIAGLGALAAIIVAIAILLSRPSDTMGPSGSGAPHASPSQSGPAPSAALLAPLGYQGAGTIAFTRSDPSGGDTSWLVAPDGSGETQLVVKADDGTDGREHPTCCLIFSPDGTQVAVGYARTDGPTGIGGFMETRILTVGGKDVRWLPNCGACAMVDGINYVPRAWSADGSLVALEAWSDDDPTRDGIYIAPTTGLGWAEQVGGVGRDVPIAFSPDGTRLLFIRMADDRRGTLMELTIPDLSDACCTYERMRQMRGPTRDIASPGMITTIDSGFGAPASWSPDGHQIAFAATVPSSSTGATGIWVVDADGGDPTPIWHSASASTGVAWSPDGNWIAHTEDFGSASDVQITRPDGSDPTNLTIGFAPSACCARWSPDASALLVAGTTGTNDASYLFIVPIDGSRIAQVTTVPAGYWDFSWGLESR